MNNKALTFDDVLLVPRFNKIKSRKDVSTKMIDTSGKLELELPIMSSNMDTITESSMAHFMHKSGGIGVLHRFMDIDRNVDEFKKSPMKTFVSVGTGDKEYERFEALLSAGADYFCVDVAHGHAVYIGEMIIKMKMKNPDICIMAGNVATYEGAEYLKAMGADIIKVGIGPGSVCTTRIKTGFGVPQLDAIEQCSKVGVSVVADGGIKTPGDIVKALAFGADFVMLGSMLSGTKYTPGEVYERASGELIPAYCLNSDHAGKGAVKIYRGMASKEVADEYVGGLTEWKTAEGVATKVPYKGESETKFIIADIIGGLRSGMTYAGVDNIRDLQKNVNYVEITNSGLIESKPHKLEK